MFAGSRRLSGPGALLVSTLVVLTRAPLAQATSAAPAPAVLWYRSSEGCPDSASFLASVGDRAPLVRLAEAGDHVDFVVNLAVTKEGARGRLELETDRGTVAIRDVEDQSCERVAEVIALNLALALDPAGAQPPASAEPPAEPDGAVSVESADAEAEPAPAQETAQGAGSAAKANPGARAERKARFRVGVQGGVQSGIASGLMAKATVFAEAGGLAAWAPDLTLRLAGVGAFGSSESSIGTIEQTLWAGRVELCPVSLGGETLSVSPCAAGELGQLSASGSRSDAALWGALGVHARGLWVLAPPLALEADVGANFPLNRYEYLAGSTVLYGSAVVGIYAGLGASIAF
jgi:hypothetical protein